MQRFVPGLGIAAVLIALACASDSVTDPKAPLGLALALSPRTDTIYISDSLGTADTAQLALTATSFGNPVTTPIGVEWSSSNAAVAVVDAQGVVHARAPGTTEITARVNDDRARSTIVVAYRTITVTIAPSVLTGLAGDTVTVTASARDANGQLVPRTAYGFGVSDAAIARIEQTGTQTARVIFLKAGTVEVGVLAGGQYGDATATVLAREFLGTTAFTLSAGLNTTCGLLPLDRGECFGSAPTIGVARDTSCFNDVVPKGPMGCTLVPLRIAGALALRQISVGDSVACGVTTGDRAYCWGSQLYGQLGNGISSAGTAIQPTLVIGAVFRTAVPLAQVSAGGNHACGLTPAGKADCWGQDSLLQLGDSSVVNSTTPIPVNDDFTFASLSAGRSHTCALQADGVAYCWGDNRFGQLGRGTVGRGDAATPTPNDSFPLSSSADAVAGGAIRFAAISAGARHTCGVSTGGEIYCWGANAAGELGRGTAGPSDGTPASLAGGGSYSAVDAGTAFTCAIRVGGAAFCWGADSYGQIGDGITGTTKSVRQVWTPTAVVGGHTFAVITAGERHVCAIATDAAAPGAYCWGSNILGSLGNELQAAVRSTPQKTAPPR